MAEDRKIVLTPAEAVNFLTCKPLDSYDEILKFLEDPPLWRSLCKELTCHSESKIRNLDLINKNYDEIQLDDPETFCHIGTDAEDPKRHLGQKLPKTLICHDMANGYHDDSYIDGTTEYDAYTFYNWAGIDIFCYFSHHLITIPPLSWINVGHEHGVKIIGTVITEWAEGKAFWDKVLASETEYQHFASALVAIANILKFDGWLLNIENKITKPDVLLEFVRYLNESLHREIPHAELIWYDSVTISGNLNWQNGLNEKNRAFFDACDGLFTNYSWNEFDLISSAIGAENRATDLYVGIDVWGRNFYAGGQFNTQEAMKLVNELGCSYAIFAPAWTHEALTDDELDPNFVQTMGQELTKWERFLLRDRALWGSFWPYLNTRLPCTLPFKTSFCRGQGMNRWHCGEVVTPGPWYNLRHQQYQPNSAHGPHGYLLTSRDTILARTCSDGKLLKEQTGIIRYRESFIQNKNSNLQNTESSLKGEVHSALERFNRSIKDTIRKFFKKSPSSSDQNVQEVKVAEKTVDENLKLGDLKDEPNLRVLKADESTERSVINEKSEQQPGTSQTPTAETYEYLKSTGKSLLSMSINLKLGQGGMSQWPHLGLVHVPNEYECFEVCLQDAFTGGSCLRVHPSDPSNHDHRQARLFHCEFQCTDSLIVCVVTKTEPEFSEQYLNLQLHMLSDLGHAMDVELEERKEPVATRAGRLSAGGVQAVQPLELSDQRFKDIQKYLLVHEPGFYVPVENAFGWLVRYYEVHFPGNRVTSINVKTGLAQGPMLLGHLGICNMIQALKTAAAESGSHLQ